MKYKCLFLDGPKAGHMVSTNIPNSDYHFATQRKFEPFAFNHDDADKPTEMPLISYKETFRSINGGMILYTLNGEADTIIINADWVKRDNRSNIIKFLEGVEVHKKGELVQKIKRLRSLADTISPVALTGAVKYLTDEILDLLSMRTGDLKP